GCIGCVTTERWLSKPAISAGNENETSASAESKSCCYQRACDDQIQQHASNNWFLPTLLLIEHGCWRRYRQDNLVADRAAGVIGPCDASTLETLSHEKANEEG